MRHGRLNLAARRLFPDQAKRQVGVRVAADAPVELTYLFGTHVEVAGHRRLASGKDFGEAKIRQHRPLRLGQTGIEQILEPRGFLGVIRILGAGEVSRYRAVQLNSLLDRRTLQHREKIRRGNDAAQQMYLVNGQHPPFDVRRGVDEEQRRDTQLLQHRQRVLELLT